MEKKFYPAVFHEEEGSYWVEFPHLQGCLTCGDSIEQACIMAEDALGEWMSTHEERGDQVPEPTSIKDVQQEFPDELVLVFGYDTNEWKKTHSTKAVKKMVSIPEWMDEEVNKRGLSLSKVLQAALNSEFNK